MTASAEAVAARWLDEVAQGGDPKRVGARFDREADRVVREAVLAVSRARGVDLPDDAIDWPGKKLLRRGQGRDVVAQAVHAMIARDEGFVCAHCGADVPPAGRGCRDHCPRCLRSLHLDVVPGDRAAGCGGLMHPVGLVLEHGEPVIRFRCVRCGHERRTRAALHGAEPDDARALAKVSAGELP